MSKIFTVMLVSDYESDSGMPTLSEVGQKFTVSSMEDLDCVTIFVDEIKAWGKKRPQLGDYIDDVHVIKSQHDLYLLHTESWELEAPYDERTFDFFDVVVRIEDSPTATPQAD